MRRIALFSLGVSAVLFCTAVCASNDSLETVEVTASREKMRREIRTFVHKVTRLEGEFVGRWGISICPLVVGPSDTQAKFIRHRLIEVQDKVRKQQSDPDSKSGNVPLEKPRRRVAVRWRGPGTHLAQRHRGARGWQSLDG